MARLGMSYSEAVLIDRGVDIDNPTAQSGAEEIVTESPFSVSADLWCTRMISDRWENESLDGAQPSAFLEFAYDNVSAATINAPKSLVHTLSLLRRQAGPYA